MYVYEYIYTYKYIHVFVDQQSHTSPEFHTCTSWSPRKKTRKIYLSKTTKISGPEKTARPLALTISKLPKPVLNDWLSFLTKHDVTTLASPPPTRVTKKREEADQVAEEEGKEKEKEVEEGEAEEEDETEGRGGVHQKKVVVVEEKEKQLQLLQQ